MTDEELTAQLAVKGPAFADAVRTARQVRPQATALALRLLGACAAGEASEIERRALFLLVHLLGEWRENAAYRPLCAVLRRPSDEVEELFGDAVTETLPRILAGLFDGDLEPLKAIALDSDAHEYVRSSMFGVMQLLVLWEQVPRGVVADILLECEKRLERADNQVWFGWQDTVARLGIVALRPLVARAFGDGCIDPMVMPFQEFADALAEGLSNGLQALPDRRHEQPLVDTIAELETWSGFRPRAERLPFSRQPPYGDAPMLNP
jgi:hypothetical protein